MEFKSSFIVMFFLVLLFVVPSFSSSSGKMELANVESGIYDIDYRGPETHTNIPPPNRGGRHNNHRQTMLSHHKSKGLLRATKPTKTGKKNHG